MAGEGGQEPEGPCHSNQERPAVARINGFGKAALSGMVAISHRWLLSTCNVASASEELGFSFYSHLNSHMKLVATNTGHCSYRGRDNFGEVAGPQFS